MQRCRDRRVALSIDPEHEGVHLGRHEYAPGVGEDRLDKIERLRIEQRMSELMIGGFEVDDFDPTVVGRIATVDDLGVSQ
jgi:hypothetical protein